MENKYDFRLSYSEDSVNNPFEYIHHDYLADYHPPRTLDEFIVDIKYFNMHIRRYRRCRVFINVKGLSKFWSFTENQEIDQNKIINFIQDYEARVASMFE